MLEDEDLMDRFLIPAQLLRAARLRLNQESCKKPEGLPKFVALLANLFLQAAGAAGGVAVFLEEYVAVALTSGPRLSGDGINLLQTYVVFSDRR
jgi:hypothetical protein